MKTGKEADSSLKKGKEEESIQAEEELEKEEEVSDDDIVETHDCQVEEVTWKDPVYDAMGVIEGHDMHFDDVAHTNAISMSSASVAVHNCMTPSSSKIMPRKKSNVESPKGASDKVDKILDFLLKDKEDMKRDRLEDREEMMRAREGDKKEMKEKMNDVVSNMMYGIAKSVIVSLASESVTPLAMMLPSLLESHKLLLLV